MPLQQAHTKKKIVSQGPIKSNPARGQKGILSLSLLIVMLKTINIISTQPSSPRSDRKG